MQLLRFIAPKTTIQWTLTSLFLVTFVIVVAPRTGIPGWGILAVALFGLGILSFSLSIETITRLKLVPWFLRSILFALGVYALTVLISFASEIHQWRTLFDLLMIRAPAPFTTTHGVALFGAFIAVLTQRPQKETKEDPPAKEIHIRGPYLISFEKAKSLVTPKLLPGRPTIFWGAMWLPLTCGPQHFSIVGDPGSGKTKSLQLLLKSVLPTIQPANNRRAILYDAKRDLLSTLAKIGVSAPIYILNPFDKRGVPWNLADDISDAATAIEIATILIPERNETQRFFPDAARALLSGVMESFLRTAPGQWTLRDVVLALRYPSRTRIILEKTRDTRYLLYKYVGEGRSDKDIASTLENTMRRLSFIAGAWSKPSASKESDSPLNFCRDPISLSKWIDSESILVLGSSPSMESTISQVNVAILHRLSQLIRQQSEANTQKPERQTWIVLDELRMAGRLDGLHSLLVEGRSKGACVVIGFQDIPGLQSVYQKELAAEIIGICANKAFLRISDPKTQNYASSVFGNQEVEIPAKGTSEGESTSNQGSTTSEGSSLSMHRITRPVILPSQFSSDLPRPDPNLGLFGYYQTALVGQPYHAKIEGHFIQQELELSGQIKSTPDFDPRPPEDIDLKEWEEEDLKRLNLKDHPDLLTPQEANDEQKNKNWDDLFTSRSDQE